MIGAASIDGNLLGASNAQTEGRNWWSTSADLRSFEFEELRLVYALEKVVGEFDG